MIFSDSNNIDREFKIDRLFGVDFDTSVKFITLANGKKSVIDRGLKFDYAVSKIVIALNKSDSDTAYSYLNNFGYEQRTTSFKFQAGEYVFGPSTPIEAYFPCSFWVEPQNTVSLDVKIITLTIRTQMTNIISSGVTTLQDYIKITPSYIFDRVNDAKYFDMVSQTNNVVETNRSYVVQEVDISPTISADVTQLLNFYYGENRGKPVQYADFPVFIGITLPYTNVNYSYRILGIKNLKRFGVKRWSYTLRIASE